MSLVKLASTAMTRFASNLPNEKIGPFASKLHDLMNLGKIPKREMTLKALGRGGLQQADYVIHPKFGPSVRKFHFQQGMHNDAREEYNDFFKYVTKKHPRSFAKFKGFEGKGRLQKDYFEFIPKDAAKADVHNTNYSIQHNNNQAKLPRNLAKDLKTLKVKNHYEVNDLSQSNILGSKIIDPMLTRKYGGDFTYDRSNLISKNDIKNMLSSHSY